MNLKRLKTAVILVFKKRKKEKKSCYNFTKYYVPLKKKSN